MRLAELIKTLHEAGKVTQTVQLSNGTRVLLLPHGGRVLGLFSAQTDENFYWTHSALASAQSAKEFYAGEEWQNSGGDRTWLAPEIELFFPKYPDLDMSGYFQPRQLDPGAYVTEDRGGHLQLVNRLRVDFFGSKREAELEIRKWVQNSADPLRYEPGGEIAGVEFAGYEQRTSLRLLNASEANVGLWNLIQMPFPGQMLISTYTQAQPHVYFGEIEDGALTAKDHLLTWHMKAKGEHKIGVKAAYTTGRVGYLSGSETEAQLVIRNFFVDPAAEYVDVPWTAQDDRGYSVQACNVNSWLGQFNELEYHVPAIGGETGRSCYTDISQVWAYRGERATLERLAVKLLG